MIVRRLASRRLVKNGSTEEEPRRKRAARFLVLILGSGTFAGIAAAIGIWPFGNLQALYADVSPPSAPPALAASSIFPPAEPIHKTVDVYQTPPTVRRSQPTAAATSRPTAQPSARPTARPTPTPTPEPDN